jgi:hypothetical protein
MPKELEQKLKKQARARGFGKERTGAYVYGTLRNTGWKPNKESKNNSKKAPMANYDRKGDYC